MLGSYEPEGFFDLAYVLSPGNPDDYHGQGALRWMRRLTDDIHAIQKRFPELVPYPTRPADGGLVYVGGTTTQHCFYWRTTGAPERWHRVPDWLVAGPTRFPLVFCDEATLAHTTLV